MWPPNDRFLVHWKKSPAALFVPVHCATLSLLRASPGWPSWPPVRRSASYPWTAPVGSTSGRPNALLRVCVPTRPWTAPFGSTFGRPNALLRVCRTSGSFPLAARPGQKSVVFASCIAVGNANSETMLGDWDHYSGTGIDVHHTVRSVTDRNGKGHLQRVEEGLHIAGAVSAAHPQGGDLRVVHDDTRVGIAADFGDRVGQVFTVEDDGAVAPGEHAGQAVRADRHHGILVAGRRELLAGGERVHMASWRHARTAARTRRFGGGLRPHLDSALVDDHIHMLVAAQADFELRPDR